MIDEEGAKRSMHLQKPFEEYFFHPETNRTLGAGDVDMNGLINLNDVSICDLAFDEDGDLDYEESTIMGIGVSVNAQE